MPDREKVLKGLEQCVNGECASCPYQNSEDLGSCFDIDVLLSDTLALLKAQEARVMSLEELNLDADESVICYSEFCDSRVVNVTAPFCYPGDRLVQLPYIGTEYRNWVDPEQYGVLWRCWTARPTDEQRKAVKWNG